MNKEYTLGIDIGTNSIGWAVVDQNYDLVKKLGHCLWGVRLFEESKSALERRTFRCARRRLQRRKVRIELLRSIFNEEINNIDSNFFRRLDESFYKLDDKTINCNDLFAKGMTNKEYYKKFPTIWHLRSYLLKTDEKIDIRLVYLAIHHIIKYRGNFLIEGEFKKDDLKVVLEQFKRINEELKELRNKFTSLEEDGDFEGNINYLLTKEFDENLINEIIDVLRSNKTKNDKKVELNKLFAVEIDGKVINNTAYNQLVIPLLLGNTINLQSLTIVKEYGIEHDKDKAKLTLDDENLETNMNQAATEFYEIKELINTALHIKSIKDYAYLLNFYGDSNFLSEAMISKYNEHHEQLSEFKDFIKCYIPDKYNEIFRKYDEKLCNYPHYVGMNNVNKQKKNFSHCTRIDFYKYIKGILENVTVEEAKVKKEEYLKLIENNNFLVRTNSSENASFPKQLHLTELKIMLDKQAKYYPFLLEKSDNITNLDKIISIFNYKRPYYYGPLKNESEYSWVVKKEDKKIYPWNINEVVDEDETAKKFIERMQNKCSYLKGPNDYCLPKESIIFSKYSVFSYINKIKINGVNIDNKTKLDIYNNIFLTVPKPTQVMIKKYLANTKNVKADDISGIDQCNCSMKSYLKFKDIFKDEFNDKIEIIENIIKDIVVFEDKKILERRLKTIYNLDEEKIKRIKGLDYKKYGRLCKNLLVNLPLTNKETGQKYRGILDVMENTTLNLQEILFSPIYEGNKAVDEYNKNYVLNTETDLMTFIDENLTISPIYTRALVQTYKLIEEIEDILGQKIDYYVVECTRTHEKSGVKKSRYEDIKNLYKECLKLAKEENFDVDLTKLSNELEKYKEVVNKADKYYFYFTQLGKDMYTLKNIDITELGSQNKKYDIDHILPQSKIKDDSISNRVLVEKAYNHNKTNNFIFEAINLTPRHYTFYKMLLEKGLITRKKYNLLTMKELDEKTLEGFVNRQKVATDQAVKSVITLLKLYKNVDPEHIIYSKASVVSQFRKDEFLDVKEETGEVSFKVKDENGNNLKKIYYKSRTANNYHHAHDAYLNAIVGRTLTKYYDKLSFGFGSKAERTQFLKDNYYTTNPMKILARGVRNTPWEPKTILPKIEHNLFNNYDIQETTRMYSPNEMIHQVTIISHDGGNGIPTKNVTPNGNDLDPKKYGGYKQASYGKFCLIKTYDKKGNEQIVLQPIPKMYDNTVKTIESYLNALYDKFEIINPNIKANIVMETGKIKSYVRSAAGGGTRFNIRNAQDRNFDINSIRIIHDIDKYFNIQEKDRDNTFKFDGNKINLANVEGQKSIDITLEDLDYLYNKIYLMYGKDIYAFSNIKNIYSKLPKTLNERFKNEDYKEKLELINQLLRLLKPNESNSANLISIGLSNGSGELRIGKTLSSGTKLVAYSITGLRKKVLYEVK